MASSIDGSALSQFSCFSCNTIPNEQHINKCRIGHIVCSKCTKKVLCKCKAMVDLNKIPNPLLQVVRTVKKECAYKEQGCTWMVSDSNGTDDHSSECKFRPYSCVGAEWGFWECYWSGLQQDLANHMKHKHSDDVKFFPHYYSGTVDFIPDRVCKQINLIDAFNKKFVFLYNSHPTTTNVVFIIYLIGRKSQAQKYMIDFELKDDLRKVKLIETCYSDADDLKSIINGHRCCVIPKKLVETYVKDKKLSFRFVVKKTENLEAENLEKKHHLLNALSEECDAPKFPQKSKMKTYRSESNLNLTHNNNNNKSHNNNKKEHTSRKPTFVRLTKS